MNRREIIEKIRSDFKGKCVDHRGSCQYLLGEKKCVIGLFIPDGHEAQSSSGGVNCLLDQYPDLVDLMPSDDVRLLTRLQKCHDNLDSSLDLDSQQQILIDLVNSNF